MGNCKGKKYFAILALILTSLSLLTACLFVNTANANPSPGPTVVEVPPRSNTIPSVISLFSPQNNSLCNTTFVVLSFKATEPSGPDVYSDDRSPHLSLVYYKMNSVYNDTSLDLTSERSLSDHSTVYEHKSKVPIYQDFSSETWRILNPKTSVLNLTSLSQGNHNITLVVWYQGKYVNSNSDADIEAFSIRSSCFINFRIDSIPPSISISPLENKTYASPNVTLTSITSEPILNSSYSLDAQENVTFAGNTTMTGLSDGLHNVTIYAWDFAGNVGSSEIAYFAVQVPLQPEPFPTAPVIAASTTSAVIACVGVIFYLRKSGNGRSTSKSA